MTLAAIVVAVAALLALVLVTIWAVRLATYKATHPYSEADLERSRRQSLLASRRTLAGKALEHLTPLLPEMLSRFNPTDCRFLGSPVDFVVFNGLDEGHVSEIVFVEVKTGRAQMNSRERLVRDAADEGRVRFEQIRLATPPVPDEPAGTGMSEDELIAWFTDHPPVPSDEPFTEDELNEDDWL